MIPTRQTADQWQGREGGGQLRPGTFEVRAKRKASQPRRRTASKARRGPRKISRATGQGRVNQAGDQAKDQGRGQAARASRATRRARKGQREVSRGESRSGRLVERGAEAAVAARHGLVADSDHGRGDRDRDLRPIPLRPGPARCPPRIARLAAGGVRVRPEEESERRTMRTRPRSRRRGRSPHTATPSTPGWIISSRPMTWSSIASRHSKRGPTSTNWHVRPTRRRWSSCAGSARSGPTSARTPRGWSATSPRSSTASAASGRSPAPAAAVLAGAGGQRRSRARRAGYGTVMSMMWTHFKSDSIVTGEVVGNRQ